MCAESEGVKRADSSIIKENFFLNFFCALGWQFWQKSMLYETRFFFMKNVDFLFTLLKMSSMRSV